MSPVGHTLMGIAIGSLVMPSRFSIPAKIVTLGLFALLAIVPDLPFPGWGHRSGIAYAVSHSIYVTTLGVIVLGTLVWFCLRRTKYYSLALIIGGALSWYSHLLLDTFYNHGRGLGMFWPFGHSAVKLPIPIFHTIVHAPIFCAHNVEEFLTEALVYGAILILAVSIRFEITSRRKKIGDRIQTAMRLTK